VKLVQYRVEVRKVDSQGRIMLPSDWRSEETHGEGEVYVLKRKGYLKIIPKKRGDLTTLFDSIDLGVEAIDDWDEFEKTVTEEER
jgi:bifunctional DNA-binding transcriptional regulator/antitoxin component of YhaV-PrlF toxin-antitoxin module